jgi:hypothetical protein
MGDRILHLSFEAQDYVTWNFRASCIRETIGMLILRTNVTVEVIVNKDVDISGITDISRIRKRAFVIK